MIKYTVTASSSCQVPGIGEFAAGETKELTGDQMQLFEALLGYPPQKGLWSGAAKLTAELLPDDEPKEA